jgi:hypothetical protein
MSDFTYEIPDERKFFAAIQQILSKSTKEMETQIADKLRNGRCSIVSSSQFSQKRWDAFSTSVHFYVSVDNLDFFDKETLRILLTVSDRIMPKVAGYDIQNVEVAPILEEISIDDTLSSDLEEIQASISNRTFQLLPADIKEKGKEMSEVYIYLYCVENSLRLFVDQIFTIKIDSDYWSKILIPNSVKKSIQVRKESESKNQWIGIRGNSDLFYLDFKEISNIIISNWELFKEYFPDQHWLNVKIDELGNCRNLIAHNSYVSSMERDVIRLNYNQILKQITLVEEKKKAIIKPDNEEADLPF